jgi:hypothetical protein
MTISSLRRPLTRCAGTTAAPACDHPQTPAEAKMMTTNRFPVHDDLRPGPEPRHPHWIATLLVVPHCLALVLLCPVFVVSGGATVLAMLVTGRYPRRVFAFNSAVLRLSRQVPYPQDLSRGVALVTWWLLAFSQYLALGLLVGGSGWAAAEVAQDVAAGAAGLIGLLVLATGMVLLVVGRFPYVVVDLVLSLHRWVLHVAVYAALTTDSCTVCRSDPDDHRLGLPDAFPGARSAPW